MNKKKCPSKAGTKKYLSLFLALVLLLTTLAGSGWSRATETSKQKIVHQVAQKWIEVGLEQYKRGFYKVAEQSFLRAQDYQEYLTVAEQDKLTELLEKAHMAALERESVTEDLQTADELTEQDQLVEAEKVQEQVPEYEESAVVRLLEPEIEKTEPLTAKGGYIQVINRKRNILRSHTTAVVNDAVAKAQNFVSEGKFDQAKQAVEEAERIINKNQLHLGAELFEQYSRQLKQLNEQILREQNERDGQLRKQKQLEAIESQNQYREQMETDTADRKYAEDGEDGFAAVLRRVDYSQNPKDPIAACKLTIQATAYV